MKQLLKVKQLKWKHQSLQMSKDIKEEFFWKVELGRWFGASENDKYRLFW